jgi:4-amino-4-deoxy-L-arabinose transferase-like glycosyltransferase
VTPPEATSSRTNRLILSALWLVFYCSFTLLSPPLLDDADSVHAEVAREMLTRRDFVTLYANGIRYLEKAPLYYWSMAASMKLFGATTAASRLPLAFAVLALALLMESWAHRAFSERAGLYAALITLSSFGIFIFSRINIPDVLVCVLLTLSLYVSCLTEHDVGAPPSATASSSIRVGVATSTPSRLLCWTFAAAIALNILTKGLIGIVFPVAIVGVYLFATRGFRGTLRRLLQCHPLSSTAILLAIAVPWHILIALANPSHGHPGDLARINGHWQVPLPTDGNVHGWAWFYFVNEQIYRYLNIRVPHDYDTSPLWLFYGLIFVWLMPWSAFLPAALRRAWPSWQRLRSRTLDSQERTNLFLIVWMLVPLLFFSLSTRQEYYVLPSLPPMILLISNFLSHRTQTKRKAQPHRDAVARAASILALLGVAAAVFCVYLIRHTQVPGPNTDLASLLQQNPSDYALSFGHFLDLNARAMAMFRLPLVLTAIAFGLILPAAYLLRRPHNFAFFLMPPLMFYPRPVRSRISRRFRVRSWVQFANLVTAASAFLFLIAAWLGLRTFSPTLSSCQLAQVLGSQLHPQDLLAIHGEYEAGSTLGFYLHRNDIHIVEGRSSNLWYGSFFPDAPPIFETRDSITQKWKGPQRIFLWQDPSDHDRPPLELPQPVYVIANSGGKQLLSNQPNH